MTTRSLAFHAAGSHSYTALTGGATLRLGSYMLSRASPPLTSSTIILDNACGPGILTSLLKSPTSPACEAKIVAADFTQGMLDQVTAMAGEKGWGGVTTQLEDMRDLKGLGDEVFSHTFTSLGFQSLMEDLEGPRKACAALYRVSKPAGSQASVSIWKERNFPKAFEATALRIRPDDPPQQGMTLPAKWDTAEWLHSLLASVGFQNVQVGECETYNEAESLEVMVDRLMVFQGFYYKGWTGEEVERARVLLGEEVRKLEGWEETEDGKVRMRMVAWVGMGWKL